MLPMISPFPISDAFAFFLSAVASGCPCDPAAYGVTSITREQVRELCEVAPQTSDRKPVFRNAHFGSVIFEGGADFSETVFEGKTDFSGAIFKGGADFSGVIFGGWVHFFEVVFEGKADFSWAVFEREVYFSEVNFVEESNFLRVMFKGQANFVRATFEHEVFFSRTTFGREAYFSWVVFHGGARFDRTRFAPRSLVEGGTFPDTASFDGMRVLSRLVFRGAPSELLRLEGSFRGTDLTYVEFENVDLARCFFEDATGVDQVGLRGGTCFDRTQKRERLADEVRFRGSFSQNNSAKARHVLSQPSVGRSWAGFWGKSADLRKQDQSAKARRLAQLYRDFRKSRQDVQNEMGAADFYYGEMEMRRRSDPWATRLLLGVYWAVSGYGLRPLRAFAMLAMLVFVATFALNASGVEDARPVSSVGRGSTFEIDLVTDMVLEDQTGTPGFGEIFLFVLGSLVGVSTFNTEMLTTTGQAVRVVLRFAGPVFLALAVLAVRSRVKR